jgi:hypothetical protein
MFFKTKIDGLEFGYRLAQYAASTVPTIDQAAEKRIDLSEDNPEESELGGVGWHVLNTVLNELEFTIIWVVALKELIMLSTNDRYAHKINAGFVQFLNEKYGDEAELQALQGKVKHIIDNDPIFSRTGYLQANDYNINAPIPERRGISYDIARLIIDKSLLRGDIASRSKEGIISLLVSEFETIYKLSAKTYKKVTII